jgi:hypothetical protein
VSKDVVETKRSQAVLRGARRASGLTCIYPYKYGYRVLVRDNGRLRHIGYFPNKNLALKAYNAAVKRRDAEKRARDQAKALGLIRREEDAARRVVKALKDDNRRAAHVA